MQQASGHNGAPASQIQPPTSSESRSSRRPAGSATGAREPRIFSNPPVLSGAARSIRNGRAADRLRRTTSADELMSVELVSAFAGDRALTAADGELVRQQKEARGALLYSDLLYSVTRHHFDPANAEALWQEILSHKSVLSARLGRNVGVAVATLDYLSNITDELQTTTLIPEGYAAEIESLAMRDGMTGLFNHSTCHELLDLELKNHQRYGLGLCVLLLDIDDFKSINDHGGHQAGDRVLVELAGALVEEARACDICCRIGGDEFVVILRYTNEPSDARELAERVRARAAQIHCNGHRIAVSIGVATCDRGPTTTPRALLEEADRALRSAKTNGKNRVTMSGPF
jgi:diguanylate cyclase (GGDEF)-like protein